MSGFFFNQKYKKLPGNTLMRTHSLWIGEHHLLYVRSRMFYEDYRRFAFKDIQSISIQKNNMFALWSFIFGICGASCVAITSTAEGLGATIFSILTGLFSLFLLINFLLGITCVCYLRTAVQPKRKLPSLRRFHKTRKALHLLVKEIEKNQSAGISHISDSG
jgi:hypothetical protein